MRGNGSRASVALVYSIEEKHPPQTQSASPVQGSIPPLKVPIAHPSETVSVLLSAVVGCRCIYGESNVLMSDLQAGLMVEAFETFR
jgi:hypothetical protein